MSYVGDIPLNMYVDDYVQLRHAAQRALEQLEYVYDSRIPAAAFMRIDDAKKLLRNALEH